MKQRNGEKGNVLLCALCTILIVSAIAGTVMINCSTRYNVVSSQVQNWKNALLAAEAGGDIAYAEVRKTLKDPANAFSGWSSSGTTFTSPQVTIPGSTSTSNSTVDRFFTDASGNPWYRIRTRGVAMVNGLSRVGMDDRMTANTKGDSLLRKIDFNYDHFVAAYGPNGDGNGKALVPVARPQLARRIELVAGPVTPFEAAIKCSGTFYGLGNAAQIDSYNSAAGPYVFAANNPSHPRYPDSRSGSVQIASAVAEIRGMLYGDVYTNGGTIVRSSQITGVIDNNVPFTIPPFSMPTNFPAPQANPAVINGNTNLTPPSTGTSSSPNYYVVSGWNGSLTINPAGAGTTYVAIHLTSSFNGKLTVKNGVRAQIFIDGNFSAKARDIVNESNLAANMQFYFISPSNPNTTQTIDLDPPGGFAGTFYAPSASLAINGNPDIIGAAVCKSFYANGNVSWHYDRQLNNEGEAIDYRIASYVEDIR